MVQKDRMTPSEIKASSILASIYALRMLGIFLILTNFFNLCCGPSKSAVGFSDRFSTWYLWAHTGNFSNTFWHDI